jgi:hypothetical protein
VRAVADRSFGANPLLVSRIGKQACVPGDGPRPREPGVPVSRKIGDFAEPKAFLALNAAKAKATSRAGPPGIRERARGAGVWVDFTLSCYRL